MENSVESVCDPSAKEGVVIVEHVDHVEGYVLSSAIVLVAEGD